MMSDVMSDDVGKDEKFHVKRHCIVGSFLLHYFMIFFKLCFNQMKNLPIL